MTVSHNQELATGGFARFLALPDHVSDYERSYLQRMTKIALWFFAAHVPAMMGVAAVAGTSVMRAGLFTTFLLLGPLLAMRTLENPRHVTKVFAVAAMCLAGLLVHFGQGAMQIEMHFYFFVLLALLAVFADPLVIIVAAGTVVVHHTLLFALLPASLFNHVASLWTVVVHGSFVVVESVAACFVARNFFDSVIGLEQKVQRRTSQLEARSNELRLMLDTIDQGFLTVDRNGVVQDERSRILDRWLPPCAPGSHVWEYLGLASAKVGRSFQIGWESVVEDVLPLELSLDQLPKTLVAGRITLELSFHPLLAAGELKHVVVVLSDVSARLEQERVEEENADLLAVCERIASDRAGFRDYLAEADQLVAGLEATEEASGSRKQLVHTLKGNSALFGLGAIARLCHVYEDALAQSDAAGEPARLALLARWQQFRSKLTVLFGAGDSDTFELREADYAVSDRLVRLGEQAKALAAQLQKAPLQVTVDAAELRVARAPWSPLWSALVHVVHNAVDHGLESAAERVVHGKPEHGTLTLTASTAGRDVLLVIADDGRGIDWDALRTRAIELGLPHDNVADLTNAMFASGVSTKRETTTLSGRGVGMGALRTIVRRMGGTIEVTSTTGQGTRIALRIPYDQEAHDASKLVA